MIEDTHDIALIPVDHATTTEITEAEEIIHSAGEGNFVVAPQKAEQVLQSYFAQIDIPDQLTALNPDIRIEDIIAIFTYFGVTTFTKDADGKIAVTSNAALDLQTGDENQFNRVELRLTREVINNPPQFSVDFSGRPATDQIFQLEWTHAQPLRTKHFPENRNAGVWIPMTAEEIENVMTMLVQQLPKQTDMQRLQSFKIGTDITTIIQQQKFDKSSGTRRVAFIPPDFARRHVVYDGTHLRCVSLDFATDFLPDDVLSDQLLPPKLIRTLEADDESNAQQMRLLIDGIIVFGKFSSVAVVFEDNSPAKVCKVRTIFIDEVCEILIEHLDLLSKINNLYTQCKSHQKYYAAMTRLGPSLSLLFRHQRNRDIQRFKDDLYKYFSEEDTTAKNLVDQIAELLVQIVSALDKINIFERLELHRGYPSAADLSK